MDNSKAWLWRKKSSEKNDDEVQALVSEKAKLEKDLKILEAKLSSALSECTTTKDELVKQTKTIGGREKVEEEAMSLKLQLEEALQHRRASEERSSHMDAALKECMQQLRFVREEQERRIHDAAMKTSLEFEKRQVVLEDKLSETSKRLSKTVNENVHLGKALLLKEKVINELNRQLNQVEADFGAVMTRLETTEKDNSSFKYEVRVLEKELEIRNEEREFNRRTAEASHRQHLENVKNIAMLESECQRLRVLVRKRFQGPASFAKMKNEVEMRTKLNPASLMTDNSSGNPTKRISMLTEQLFSLEEENKALRRVLNKRSRDSLISQELSLASASEIGSDDKASCAESWASALISELENFRNEKQKGSQLKRGIEASDIDLMDDFVEMEKLAVVSVNNPARGSHVSSNDAIPIAVPLEFEHSIWLQDTLKLVLEQNRVTGRSFQEIVEEIRVALDHIAGPKPDEKILISYEVSSASPVNVSQSNKSSKCIHKMIELIEGLGLPSLDKNGNYSRTSSETPEGYTARVFQWKTSELNAVLQQYVLSCYDLLNENPDLDKFVQQLTIALEWMINHCFSLQDVSSMRDAIIKQCDWDDCESEAEAGIVARSPGMDSVCVEEARKSKDELMESESLKKELEGRLQSATETSDELGKKLYESEKAIETLQTELQALRKEKGMIEHHQKMKNEDLDTQLAATRQELSEARQQFSSLKVELENKNNSVQELQAACVELELQLESGKNPIPDANLDQEEEQLQNDREITAASEKLAECQETIFNLGKQLKALSTPSESAPFDKAIVTPTDAKTDAPTTLKEGKSTSHRTSLLDRMLADDGASTKNQKSPETKEIDSNSTTKVGPYGPIEPLEKILILGTKNPDTNDGAGDESMAIVTAKKRGGGGGNLWKKLLWRKKKVNGKPTSLSLTS